MVMDKGLQSSLILCFTVRLCQHQGPSEIETRARTGVCTLNNYSLCVGLYCVVLSMV